MEATAAVPAQAATNVVLDPNVNAAAPEAAPEAANAPAADAAAPEAAEGKSAAEAKPEAPKPEPKKYKLKVKGEEIELPEEEVLRRAQIAEAADRQFKETKKLRGQLEAFWNAIQKNPLAILTDPKLGLPPEQLEKAFEQWYIARQQEQALTPEQRQQLQERQELSRYRTQEQQRQDALKANMQRDLQAKVQQEIAAKVEEALKLDGIPKNEKTVSRMADLMAMQLELGVDPTPQQLVHLVRDQISTELKSVVGTASGAEIVKLFGEDLVNKIRKYDLERLRGTASPAAHEPPAPRIPAAPSAAQERPGYKSEKEFAEYMQKNFGVAI